VEPIGVELSGVPETLLGNLGRRAAAARIGALDDPRALTGSTGSIRRARSS
jgi:hypothetical protein